MALNRPISATAKVQHLLPGAAPMRQQPPRRQEISSLLQEVVGSRYVVETEEVLATKRLTLQGRRDGDIRHPPEKLVISNLCTLAE